MGMEVLNNLATGVLVALWIICLFIAFLILTVKGIGIFKNYFEANSIEIGRIYYENDKYNTSCEKRYVIVENIEDGIVWYRKDGLLESLPVEIFTAIYSE